MAKNLRIRLDELNDIAYIIFMVALNWFLYLPFILLTIFYEKYIGDIGGPCSFYNNCSSLLNILFIVILFPIFETCIQSIIIKFLTNRNFTKKQILFTGTIIFSLIHCYSVFYIIALIIPSFILFYSYIYYKNKQISSYYIALSINILSSLIVYLEQV